MPNPSIKLETDFKMKSHNLNKVSGAQSLKRAIKLLRVISSMGEKEASLSNLSRNTGINVSTTHRILNALVEEDFISYDKETKIYRLGLGLMLLGINVQESNLRYHFRPALNQLAEKTQDTVLLMVRHGHEMICIDRVEGEYPIRTFTFNVGDRRPLGLGAGALAVLSVLPDDKADQIIGINKKVIYKMSSLGSEELRTLVKKARRLGYALSQGVVNSGVTGVAIPVLTEDGEPYAAISVSSVHERLKRNRRNKVVKMIKVELSKLSSARNIF